ncbi:heme biosynthesis HemY N-terminal domain-containing protein, partial [Staphylococcus aureus]
GSGARSRREGYRAFTEGMVAIAAGDARAAQAAAQRAKKLLDQPALALLLSAQAAQAAGDEEEAGRQYAAMLGHPETEF